MGDRVTEHLLAVVLVGVGGVVGSMSRYGVDIAVGGLLTITGLAGGAGPALGGFPLGTLAVNVVGSFALGALTPTLGNRRLRLFLATGLLSSFTTYSAFAVDIATLDPAMAAATVVATYVFGIAAAGVGLSLGRRGRIVGGDR